MRIATMKNKASETTDLFIHVHVLVLLHLYTHDCDMQLV